MIIGVECGGFPLFLTKSADDGTYAMKKVNIQTEQKLDVVRHEINVSSMFNHPNLLPLLDHAIIPVKVINNILLSTSVIADLHSLIDIHHKHTRILNYYMTHYNLYT